MRVKRSSCSERSASESDLGNLSLPNPRGVGTSGRQAVTFQVGSCELSSGNPHPAGVTSSGITCSRVSFSCLFAVELKNETPTDVKMEKKKEVSLVTGQCLATPDHGLFQWKNGLLCVDGRGRRHGGVKQSSHSGQFHINPQNKTRD